jgi:hypothetical protein
VTQFAFDVGNAQEMQVMVGGGLGESEPVAQWPNIIRAPAANTFSGSAFSAASQSNLQSDNVHRRSARARVFQRATVRQELGQHAVALGGPILSRSVLVLRQRAADPGSSRFAPGWHGADILNLGDATRWGYARRRANRELALNRNPSSNLSMRLTDR